MSVKLFSKNWKSSTNRSKQRKYRLNAFNHIKSKFCNVNLSKELRKVIKKRTVRVREDDLVKVVRGDFKGVVSKVIKVMPKTESVLIEGINKSKQDGNKVPFKIKASNLMINSLVDESKRFKKEEGVKEKK